MAHACNILEVEAGRLEIQNYTHLHSGFEISLSLDPIWKNQTILTVTNERQFKWHFELFHINM